MTCCKLYKFSDTSIHRQCTLVPETVLGCTFDSALLVFDIVGISRLTIGEDKEDML